MESKELLKIIQIQNKDIQEICLNKLYYETIKKEEGKEYNTNIDDCINFSINKYNTNKEKMRLCELQFFINQEKKKKELEKKQEQENLSIEEIHKQIRDHWTNK